jgi:hypothetical protein
MTDVSSQISDGSSLGEVRTRTIIVSSIAKGPREAVRAVAEYPTPSTPKHIQQFLGLATYYRRFREGPRHHRPHPSRPPSVQSVEFCKECNCKVTFSNWTPYHYGKRPRFHAQSGIEFAFVYKPNTPKDMVPVSLQPS